MHRPAARHARLPALALLALGLPLALAACVGDAAPVPVLTQPLAPLSFDYLPKLRLNVASVRVENRSAILPGDVSSLSPIVPAGALRQMAEQRLVPAGSAGTAVFVIDDASIIQAPGSLTGTMTVHLDVLTGDGQRAAFAEARVARIRTTVNGGDLPTLLATLTREMMDQMNVEFEYQVRHALRDWLQEGAAGSAVPAPVQQQDLGGSAPAPATVVPAAPAAPSMPAPPPIAPPQVPGVGAPTELIP